MRLPKVSARALAAAGNPASAQASAAPPRRRTFARNILAVAAIFAAACFLLAAPAAHAQNVTATASVTDNNVETGQAVEYHIQITGGQPDRPPPAPQVPGLTITYVGENTSMQLVNENGTGFRVTRTATYSYNIDADRAGRYVIPAQEIDLGTTTVRTSAVSLNVTGNNGGTGAAGGAGAAGGRNAGQAMMIQLVVPKKTAFVGESIPIEVRCYFGVQLKIEPDPNPILSGDGFSTQKFAQPQIDAQVFEGVQYNVVTYRSSVAAAKVGDLTLGPVELDPVVQMPRPQIRGQRRFASPFDDPFFNDPFGTITKQVKMRSEPVKMEVKPLPPGAPEDFSGAIGQFKLEATADARKAQAGDPVTLRAVLRGQGNFDRIQAPVLTEENGLQTYPATAKFKAEDDINLKGAKTFEQVIIPRNGRASLPGYRLAYLDPATGKYATLETPPIAVKIQGSLATPTPAADKTAAGAARPDAGTPAAAKPTPTPKPEDILYIRNDPGPALSGEAFLPLYRRRVFWLAQLVPLGLLIGGALLVWRHRRAHDAARARAADLQRLQGELVRTLQGEKTGRREFYTAATRLAQLKAAATAGKATDSLTATEVCRARGLDPATTASVEEIFHRHDELAYSGGRAAQEAVPIHERRDVLATLETVGRL